MDHDGEIVDLDSVKGVWKSFMANPVIRYFHGKDNRNPDAIGTVIPEYTDASGKTYKTEMTKNGPFIVAKISNAPDTESIRTKISEGILKGFSIGGRAKRIKEYSNDLGKDISRVITQRISEISVVDLPANPDSFFTVLKGCVGEHCNLKIKNENPELVTIDVEDNKTAENIKKITAEISKIESENSDLEKQIAELKSSTESNRESEEVVMKKINGGINMDIDENIVRFEPSELKDFIKSTMVEFEEDNAILAKADSYDKLLAETVNLRQKIEALEAKAKAAAAAVVKSETTEVVEDAVEKTEDKVDDQIENRITKLEESPLYKSVQGDTTEKETKVVKGHLASIVSAAFGTDGGV